MPEVASEPASRELQSPSLDYEGTKSEVQLITKHETIPAYFTFACAVKYILIYKYILVICT